ncbi:hypothetical protein MBANPS3_012500 [Mucor bainieri]
MPFTIKTALNTVCQYDDVKNTIRDVCAYATKLVYFGSIFVNYFVLFMMENDIEIPKLDQTLVYTCFSLMADERSKATAEMREAYQQFKNTPVWTNDFQASLRNIQYMKVISYLARTYATSLRLHLADNIEKRTQRYFFTLLSDYTMCLLRKAQFGIRAGQRSGLHFEASCILESIKLGQVNNGL